MYLLGNILAVHLVEDVLERRNVVVVPVSYTHRDVYKRQGQAVTCSTSGMGLRLK